MLIIGILIGLVVGIPVGVIWHGALKNDFHKAGTTIQLAPNHAASVSPSGAATVTPTNTAVPPAKA